MDKDPIILSNNGETAIKSFMGIANNPAFIALISQTGPFNTAEWINFVESNPPEKVAATALDFFKDASLMAEAARPHGGRNFQTHLLGQQYQVDVKLLEAFDHQRTKTPVFELYRQMGIMRDISAFYVFGKAYTELDASQQAIVDDFGLITDISHFGRIMGKDGKDVDDIQKTWLVADFAFALERNLNASFTSRGQDEVLFNVPNKAVAENYQTVMDRSPKGEVVAMRSQRKTEPNVSFMFSIEQPQVITAENIEVPVSFGRGDIRMIKMETTEQLLSYLSTQFDSLLLNYPLEKAALIIDKFIYGRKLDRFGISLAAVQAVKDLHGQMTAKILRVGNAGVGIISSEQTANQEIVAKAQNKDTSMEDLMIIARDMQLDITDIDAITNQGKKRNLLVGRIMQSAKSSRTSVEIRFTGEENEARLGTIQQAAHVIETIKIDEGTSFLFLPPAIAAKANTDQEIAKANNQANIAKALNKISPQYAFTQERFTRNRLQTLDNSPWTEEMINSQLAEFREYIEQQAQEYNEVSLFIQHSHIHPTQATHGPKQEHGAHIARIFADSLRAGNISIKSGCLVDEYHTSDLMKDYNWFDGVLAGIAGEMYSGIFLESSARMRLFGDALVRMLMGDENTTIQGGTVVYKMPEGRTLELWDAAMTGEGEFTPGRQACVPFELGMNLALMHPELADNLFVAYLLKRYPNSALAKFVSESGRTDSDRLMVENIMMAEKDIMARNAKRMAALSELERSSFAEIWQTNPDITAFDIYAMDVLYRTLKSDLDEKRRKPIVIHVLETNYNAQQSKSGWLWSQFGIPGLPIYRISFDSASKTIKVLESPAPSEARLGEWLDKNRSIVEQIRGIMEGALPEA